MAINEEANREGRLFTPQPNNPVPRCQSFRKEELTLADLKDFAPVQINTLYGFENVKDFYWLIGYDVVNLQTGHIKRAFENGHGNRTDKIFKVVLKSGELYEGTLKELSARLNIPRQTLYCRYYAQTPGRKIQSVRLVPNFDNRSTD